MPTITSINQNRDFRRIYARGKSYVDSALVVYVLNNRANCCRLGITVSKKLGGAVKRNRTRRVIKEAFRQLPPISRRVDIVVVARMKAASMKSTEILPVLKAKFHQAGIL